MRPNTNDLSVITGIVEGKPTFETSDLDFVASLLTKSLYAITASTEATAVPIRSRIRLADLRPFSNPDAVYDDKSTRYTFVIQSEDGDETADQLNARMRNLSMLFMNNKTLVDPVGFAAWRRQLRMYLIETDKRQRKTLPPRTHERPVGPSRPRF